MSKPLFFGGKKSNVIFVALILLVIGSMIRFMNTAPVYYAHAYEVSDGLEASCESQSKLLAEQPQIFEKDGKGKNKILLSSIGTKNQNKNGGDQFVQKIYEIVGEAPIKEMVPFISKRDEKVAAFLVGIAKKESSFGEHSPSKNGQTCYNYWGYKGSAGNGSAMGYACFASAEEAIETVGNRIEVLVGKNRNTPAKMVNTWKCGVDCSGDPGAPGWVATVAMYFEKIVG